MNIIVATELAAIWLGFVFMLAGIVKMSRPIKSSELVVNYLDVPQNVSMLLIHILAVLEIFVGVALVVGPYERYAAMACAGLLILFTASGWRRGHAQGCGCFGNLEGSYSSRARRDP